MPEAKLIPGVEIRLGAETFVLPKMNLFLVRTEKASLQKATKLLQDFSERQQSNAEEAIPFEFLEIVADLVHKTLKRNYPDLQFAQVEEGLDIEDSVTAFTALLTSKKVEDGAPGEVRAG